ncbi:TIGR02450 family Trp-rich protein [Pseudomonas sp.]|uniref:TIGR02450 family Trp-rich protein n=1 Tax=Pseudomonas sp. TaxID=306 RepID=UPI00299D81BE|nr:TIGR02450 family Trp-rich protein [Pseudomonas sp.]MDX1369729.1 TIGR02450 family Trp-rich protein [Pseudomonas sp.]
MSGAAAKATARHRLNPGKLLLSKWTAVQPQNREKHFLVSELFCDEQGQVLQIELQAVLSQRCQRLDWRALEDAQSWHMGWK